MRRNGISLSRRQLLKLGFLSILSTSGCIEVKTDPRDGDDAATTAEPIYDQTSPSGYPTSTEEPNSVTPTEEPSFETPERECTNAYVSSFDWQSSFDSPDAFYATILNQADVAGEIVVQLSFYQNEDGTIPTGTVEQIVPIGAQETRDILIETNPPTSDSSWAEMEVTEQGCNLDF